MEGTKKAGKQRRNLPLAGQLMLLSFPWSCSVKIEGRKQVKCRGKIKKNK